MTGLPFLDRFHEPIRRGHKTATARTRAYGKPGELIRTPVGWVRLIDVMRVPLSDVRDSWWEKEGCDSPDEFVQVWNELHPRIGFDETRQVWLHLFELTEAS